MRGIPPLPLNWVWHEGLIYKIKYMGVKADLQASIESSLLKKQ